MQKRINTREEEERARGGQMYMKKRKNMFKVYISNKKRHTGQLGTSYRARETRRGRGEKIVRRGGREKRRTSVNSRC